MRAVVRIDPRREGRWDTYVMGPLSDAVVEYGYGSAAHKFESYEAAGRWVDDHSHLNRHFEIVSA